MAKIIIILLAIFLLIRYLLKKFSALNQSPSYPSKEKDITDKGRIIEEDS